VPLYKILSTLSPSLSITLSLALAISLPAWAGEDFLAFYDGKAQSSGSPYGDILKSIEKGKEQKKEEPKTPKSTPQSPSPSELQKQLKELQENRDKLESSPQTQPEVPPELPAQPAKMPKLSEKTYKNLPPLLKQLKDLEDKIENIYSKQIPAQDPSIRMKSCNEVNKLSNEAMQLLFQLFSRKDEAKVPDDFYIGLVFCKESNAEYQTYGWDRSEREEIKHHVVGSLKVLWQAQFLIDVKNRDGHLISYVLFRATPKRTTENNIQIVKYEGKVIRNLGPDNRPTQVPVDGYDLMGEGAAVIIVSKESYSPSFGNDPSKWPDNLPTQYSLYFARPPILYYSSKTRQQKSVNSCDFCLNPFTLEISPEGLSQAIEKGILTISEQDNCHSPRCTESEFILEINLPPMGCKTDKNSGPGAIAVAGDCIDHGGYILPTEDKVFVNGKPVARVGDKVLCLIHGITEIVGDKSNNVFSGKRQIARVGDKTKCGAKIMGGSPDTSASQGKP
jgi:uncharacterized Zn-binding protein involved in type VI secretion